eukprot:scaffold8723_cov116-Isochrysis_galbana.AAC.2
MLWGQAVGGGGGAKLVGSLSPLGLRRGYVVVGRGVALHTLCAHVCNTRARGECLSRSRPRRRRAHSRYTQAS